MAGSIRLKASSVELGSSRFHLASALLLPAAPMQASSEEHFPLILRTVTGYVATSIHQGEVAELSLQAMNFTKIAQNI